MHPDSSAAPEAAHASGTRLLRAGVTAFALVVVGGWLLFNALNGGLNDVDLTVYRDGGLIVRHVSPYYDPRDWAPLYGWGGYSALALKFTYTPFAAIAFAVASFLPWGAMQAASVAGNMAALVAALWFTLGGLGYRDRRVRLGATLLAATVTFWLQPVIRTIYLGQVNLLLTAMIMWDLCQPRTTTSGRPRWWKGIATGVAAGVKLVPLIFVPYLLLTRRFREAVATVAGFAATVVIGFAVLPHDSSTWWLHGMFLSDGNRTGFRGWAGTQSLRAVITRLAGSIAGGQDPWLAAAVVALALGMLAACLLDRAGYPVPALLATALTGLLVSPVSWDHHWVWIALAVAVAGHYALAATRPALARLSAASPGPAGPLTGPPVIEWPRPRRTARWLWGLGGFMIAVFGAWPDALWESARTLGNLSLGFLWAQPNTNPVLFATRGDQPWYAEYHWHGFQLLWGNAYLLAGLVLLATAIVIGLRLRRIARPGPTATPEPVAETLPAS
ncbi:MAG TPA: glycosyltransferase 87 family protein [Trebonia sp.]|nr:glycosyltransferase 87 family protein [Trebonia sp.]